MYNDDEKKYICIINSVCHNIRNMCVDERARRTYIGLIFNRKPNEEILGVHDVIQI